MRLPTIGGDRGAPIDHARARGIIDVAMAHGVNYYDTAYVYHNGESEKFLGEAMKKYQRDSYCLATKFFISANPDYRVVFEEQLARLNTEYIDFYLLHAISDHNWQQYISSGCITYFLEQQKKGHIKYLGFSSHAAPSTLVAVADHHQWDFAQIQLNYLDWQFGTAKREYEVLTERNIPVIVMEPVRGGRLASLTEALDRKLKAVQPNWSVASWALRWVKRLPNVKVILSGMSTLEQIKENVALFEADEALSDEQAALLEEVGRDFKNGFTIPCTECRYCCGDCPQALDIPRLLSIYNDYKYVGWWTGGELSELPADKCPSACIGCGACQDHCPQSIGIPAIMKEFAALENSENRWMYKGGA